MKLSRKRSKDKPWIKLKQSIKQKHLLYQKYIYNFTGENNQTYKIFKNKLRTLIRKAEADYYKESFNHKTQSMKRLWRELGNLLDKSKKKSNNSISGIIVDNKILNMTKILQMHSTHILHKLVKILPTKLCLRNHILM